MIERRRYAGPVSGAGAPVDDLAGDLDIVIERMQIAVSPGARRGARWLPRSVFRRDHSVRADAHQAGSSGAGADRLLELV